MMDPITKLIWTFVVAWWLYGLRDLKSVVIVSFGVALLSFLGSRFNLMSFLKVSGVIFVGGWGLLLYQGLFRPGPGISIGALTLSYEGMALGFSLALRVFGLVAAGWAFSVSTSPQDMELAMVKMRIPYKIARVGYLALRLIPIFQRDAQAIDDIQTLRKVKKGTNRFRKSITALIATEFRLVDSISIALETRGFGLYETRTDLKAIRISVSGAALVIVTLGLMLLHYSILGLL
ncbi:energy-coupling factor transporter transmembrane protein EcfT [candidate division WWE3 bacterium]|uniref:Energy-coupling factor transporter transmembrane protein EcfT n=1 Tax=candidate division WWE3 bacterium TaxID=2053526 RepID=A0A7X9HI68_UNCKA|nr:energy-coupling factor transporter transmembrane protein EcfT [candidate division WWE3 bacterium]